jgi:hypothetical protein
LAFASPKVAYPACGESAAHAEHAVLKIYVLLLESQQLAGVHVLLLK